MITASYFRSHAATCIQLSRAITDERVAAKLVRMAEDFTARAEELDAEERRFSSRNQKLHEGGTDLN